MPSLPPPLPTSSPPPIPMGYRRAQIVGQGRWVTVASLQTASQWHVACAALSRQQILSRVNPDTPESSEMELQVPATEAEWASDILKRLIPGEVVGTAGRLGGFPVVGVSASLGDSNSASTVDLAMPGTIPAMPVGALRTVDPPGAGHYFLLVILWIALVALLLIIVLTCAVNWLTN